MTQSSIPVATVYESGLENLKGITVEHGGAHDITFNSMDNNWSLMLDLDVAQEELIFTVDMKPSQWLALGFAPDLIEADVIWWEAGATGYAPEDQPQTMTEEIDLRGQSKVFDRISVHGVLLEDKKNQMRNFVHLDDYTDRVRFTTWRAFGTKDPLDQVLALNSKMPISLAAGKSGTSWEEKTFHGSINLYLNKEPTTDSHPVKQINVRPTFEQSRISEYEAHGWWCLMAWFPIGFMLLATQRYYKTRWWLMFHVHNLLGLGVLVVTVWSSFEMYAYHNWKQNVNIHSILGLITLAGTAFVGGTGLVTAGMMQFTSEKMNWRERDKHYSIAKIHRYSSWFLLILANGICSGGVATYFSKIGFGIYGTYGVCSSLFFLLMIVIHELCIRKYDRNRLNS